MSSTKYRTLTVAMAHLLTSAHRRPGTPSRPFRPARWRWRARRHGGGDDGGAEADAGLAAEPLDGPADADRGEQRRPPSTTGALTDATPASRSSTLSTQPAGPSSPRQDAAGRADVERQQGALGHDPAQPVGRLQRHDAAPPVALAHEQLHALAGLVAQRGEPGPGEVGEREPVGGGVAEPDERQPEAEPPVGVAAHQAVLLEGDGQAVGRRPRQPGRRLQLGEAARARRARAARSTATALSSTPTFDTLSIWSRTLSQNVRCSA